jgi:uncharacterized membrane protein
MKLLIDDWKRAWRLLSVQVAAVLVALELAGDYLPEIKEYLGDDYAKWLGLAVIVARVVRQTPTRVDADARSGGPGRDVAAASVARGEE